MTKEELFKADFDERVYLDAVGGVITIGMINHVFSMTKWHRESSKIAYTTPELWDALYNRLPPPTLCIRCTQETEATRYGLIRDHGIYYVLPDSGTEVRRVPVLADQACPAGTFCVLDLDYDGISSHAKLANLE